VLMCALRCRLSPPGPGILHFGACCF
jgi:hypothetical protein